MIILGCFGGTTVYGNTLMDQNAAVWWWFYGWIPANELSHSLIVSASSWKQHCSGIGNQSSQGEVSHCEEVSGKHVSRCQWAGNERRLRFRVKQTLNSLPWVCLVLWFCWMIRHFKGLLIQEPTGPPFVDIEMFQQSTLPAVEVNSQKITIAS